MNGRGRIRLSGGERDRKDEKGSTSTCETRDHGQGDATKNEESGRQKKTFLILDKERGRFIPGALYVLRNASNGSQRCPVPHPARVR